MPPQDEFIGDVGHVTAKLSCGTLCEELAYPMAQGRVTTRRHDDDPTYTESDHPDFYSRFAAAYDNELGAFFGHIARGEEFEVGPAVGWRTVFVANAAGASARQNGTFGCLVHWLWLSNTNP